VPVPTGRIASVVEDHQSWDWINFKFRRPNDAVQQLNTRTPLLLVAPHDKDHDDGYEYDDDSQIESYLPRTHAANCWLQGPPAHVPARLRLSACQARHRHAHSASLVTGGLFRLARQIGDTISYFRPPLKPTGINVRDIIPPAPPAASQHQANAECAHRRQRVAVPTVAIRYCALMSRPLRRFEVHGCFAGSIFVMTSCPLIRSASNFTLSPGFTAFSKFESGVEKTIVLPCSISSFGMGPCLMVIFFAA
jgi:hypothetical protein